MRTCCQWRCEGYAHISSSDGVTASLGISKTPPGGKENKEGCTHLALLIFPSSDGDHIPIFEQGFLQNTTSLLRCVPSRRGIRSPCCFSKVNTITTTTVTSSDTVSLPLLLNIPLSLYRCFSTTYRWGDPADVRHEDRQDTLLPL